MANVTIHCDTEGAEIRYTVNQEGSPENGTLYEAPFSASEGDVIRAIGMKEGMENSQVAEVTISQMEDEVTRYHVDFTKDGETYNGSCAGIGSINTITDKIITAQLLFNVVGAGTLKITPTYISPMDYGTPFNFSLTTNGDTIEGQFLVYKDELAKDSVSSVSFTGPSVSVGTLTGMDVYVF